MKSIFVGLFCLLFVAVFCALPRVARAEEPELNPYECLGRYEAATHDNRRIFAHIRSDESETLLCVHNFARSAEPVQLDLQRYSGLVPRELFGETEFPPIGELPYLLTLKPSGFFWFRLCAAGEA